MKTQDIIKDSVEKAKEEIVTHNILKDLRDNYGEPIFLMLSGAHNFGFPSVDSDLDIRGVYVAPTDRFLGLRKNLREPTYEYMSHDRMMDASVDEVGHYLQILSESNGNRLEWPQSDLVIYKSDEFEGLKEVVNAAGVSKALLNHYLHFARDMWEGKTKEEGVKKDLYALRVYMSGISIFEDCNIISDINTLNQKFGYSIVDDMVAVKQMAEHGLSEGYDKDELTSIVEKLDARLQTAALNSQLPEKPDIERINKYLIDLRHKY